MSSDASDGLVVELGSRSGTSVALLLFGVVFGLLGWGVAHALGQRGVVGRRNAAIAGALLTGGLLALVYLSSWSGFYAARASEGVLTLEYLHRAKVSMSFPQVRAVRAEPAFRSRWRVHVLGADGSAYESATSDRNTVERAAQRLRELTACGE